MVMQQEVAGWGKKETEKRRRALEGQETYQDAWADTSTVLQLSFTDHHDRFQWHPCFNPTANPFPRWLEHCLLCNPHSFHSHCALSGYPSFPLRAARLQLLQQDQDCVQPTQYQ